MTSQPLSSDKFSIRCSSVLPSIPGIISRSLNIYAVVQNGVICLSIYPGWIHVNMVSSLDDFLSDLDRPLVKGIKSFPHV